VSDGLVVILVTLPVFVSWWLGRRYERLHGPARIIVGNGGAVKIALKGPVTVHPNTVFVQPGATVDWEVIDE
jgi:hypothetical protein